MAACPSCGEANPAHARFCLACGAALLAEPAPIDTRRTVTVVFCDVVDSTPLGERLDAEAYRRVISRYFIEASRVVEAHGGIVEKFIGDAVMAVFGMPTVHEDDALRAVRAAADLREAVGRLNERLRTELGVELGLRTGVNTGEVVAGDAAAGQAFATGEAVAIAQRFEAAASPGEIVVGDSTYRLVRDAVLVEPLGELELKGRSAPVRAWRLLGVVSGAPGFTRRLDAPIVGREDELAALREAYDGVVAARECRLVVVVGPAGIGKSRLGNEFVSSLGDAATTLLGRCLPYGDGITYWPLRDIVRAAAGALTQDAIDRAVEGANDAPRIAAGVAGALGVGGATTAPEETMWAVRRLFEHLARERPLVVGLDDLHWAEPTLLDLVEYLVGWTSGAPVLIVALARPELDERRPGWPGALPNATTLTLSPLTDDEATTLLDLLRGDARLPADLLSRITNAAEGNPLFVEQMLAMLTEDGSSGELTIPPSIQALLAARLDRLQPDERRAIERASVVGREFDRGAVRALAPPPPHESLDAVLLSLVRRDLIMPYRSPVPGEDGFRFRHILIRDAAYLAIPKTTRAELHARYADHLEATPQARDLDEIVGYHLEQAHHYRAELGLADKGDLAARAGERLAAAGRRALAARGDVPAAAGLLSRAISLVPPGHALRGELLVEVASALMLTGDFARADDVLDEAAAAAHGDARVTARISIEREFHKIFAGAEEVSRTIPEVTAAAIPVLERADDQLGLARAWRLRGEVAVLAGRWGERVAALERALEHARLAADAREEATLVGLIVMALYFGPTPVEQGIARCDGLLAELGGEQTTEAAIWASFAGLLAMRGDFDEARRLWAAASERFEELGLRYRRAVRSTIGADIEALAGNDEAAERELRWAYETLERMGEKGTRAVVAAFLGEHLARRRRDDEAADFVEIAAELAAADDLVPQALCRAVRAKLLARGGSVDEAERLARDAAAMVQGTDFPELQATASLSLAEVMEAAGRAEEARKLVERAREAYEQKGNVVAARRMVPQVNSERRGR